MRENLVLKQQGGIEKNEGIFLVVKFLKSRRNTGKPMPKLPND
jgi:hypothetical protein